MISKGKFASQIDLARPVGRPIRLTIRGKKLRSIFLLLVMLVLSMTFLFPLVITVTNSFMTEKEITQNYLAITTNIQNNIIGVSIPEFVNIKFIPDIVTFKQYFVLLIERSNYLSMFWNSVLLVLPIVAGQIIVASLAAYAFTFIKFKGRENLFLVYIITMMMPFQVTLVSNYLIIGKLGLSDNYLSIILPGIFNTFGVFLLRQFMTYIPEEYIEAAKIDGGSHLRIYSRIILPMVKSGVAALAILIFIDNWNMVEQPLIFLQSQELQPLSIFLSNINIDERGISFAASTIYMIPMLLIFIYGENYLIEGIQLSGLKG